MFAKSLLVAALAVNAVHAQATYSGCHSHGDVEYCYGPDGEETAMATNSATSMITPAPVSATASTTTSGQTTAVTACHGHGTDVYCINGAGDEVFVSLTATPTGEMPAQYTDCHGHGSEQYCVDPDGNDVLVVPEGATVEEDSHEGHSDEEESSESSGENCHFHAGVEHCTGAGESESSGSTASCGLRTRDYDVPLRIGTLFVLLATSSIGVFAPILLSKLPFRALNQTASIAIKQFGTGVIIATAFIHLYTHAYLMFSNDCIGTLEYEGTTSAIVMAGIVLAFLTEYLGHRYILARSPKRTEGISSADPTSSPTSSTAKEADAHPAGPSPNPHTLVNLGHNHGSPFDPTNPNTKVSVLVMEAGVLFHSILIGVTLVVAGDSFYKTLLVVIVFHQFFEGLALGARIALLPGAIFPTKAAMAGAFALITPIGMAIGLGVLNSFNGNDKSTLIAMGTLDALSAGILVWVGVVDMLARDWVIEGGELLDASAGKVLVGGVSLVAGLALMGLLGKWA